MLKTLSTKLRFEDVESTPDVGYVKALVPLSDYQNIGRSRMALSRGVLLNPRAIKPMGEHLIRKLNKEPGLNPFTGARGDTAAFSGLTRIGTLDFTDIVEKEIGTKVDGSNVTVGVVDTGVTLNHPAFKNAERKSN